MVCIHCRACSSDVDCAGVNDRSMNAPTAPPPLAVNSVPRLWQFTVTNKNIKPGSFPVRMAPNASLREFVAAIQSECYEKWKTASL